MKIISMVLEVHGSEVPRVARLLVEPTVVGFRPLPTATRQPPWDPESVIVDDLGVAPRRRERRVR